MLVAVYGTLKQGRSNHCVMQRASGSFVGEATLEGFEMYTNGGFPVIYKTNHDSTIAVELFSVEDIDPLDSLEGHPTWYRREQVATPHGDAWIYIMQDESYKHSWTKLDKGVF